MSMEPMPGQGFQIHYKLVHRIDVNDRLLMFLVRLNSARAEPFFSEQINTVPRVMWQYDHPWKLQKLPWYS
jgi:hypothetical protein